MPGTDARSAANNPRGTAELDNDGSGLAHEEGLATALSTFLSQLHSAPGAAPASYAPDPGPAVVQALRAKRLPRAARDENSPTGATTAGGLTRRLVEDPEAIGLDARPDRTPGTRSGRPLVPAFGTGSAVGLFARVPQSDAWAITEPATGTDRPAAARAAAVAHGRPGLTARTSRKRPVPEIRVDDLPEPWLGTDSDDPVWLQPSPGKKPGRGETSAQLANEPSVSLLDEPTVVNDPLAASGPVALPEPSVQQEPTSVPEPTVVQEPTVLQDPSLLQEPTSVPEPTAVQQPTVVEEPAAVEEPTVAEEPAVLRELMALNDLITGLEPAVLDVPTVMNEAALAADPIAVDEPSSASRPSAGSGPLPVREPVLAGTLGAPDEAVSLQELPVPLPRPEDQVIAPAPGTGRQRKAAVAGLALAIFAAATLGISVYWGYKTNDTLNQRNLELATTEASLGAVQESLNAAQTTLLRQHHSYAALKVGIKEVAEQYVATKTQLKQVQIDLGRTQGQLTQAQSQVGRAQDQLGNTQQNLSTTQSHAAQIQHGALLLQQTVQLLASLIVLENNYITAAQGHNAAAMKNDLTEMRTLEAQAQTLEPKASPPAH